jgi:hypothetical protein
MVSKPEKFPFGNFVVSIWKLFRLKIKFPVSSAGSGARV